MHAEPRAAAGAKTPNAQKRVEVSRSELPLHCPTPDATLWNSHPRVYLPLAELGEVTCPYCGSHYSLKD